MGDRLDLLDRPVGGFLKTSFEFADYLFRRRADALKRHSNADRDTSTHGPDGRGGKRSGIDHLSLHVHLRLGLLGSLECDLADLCASLDLHPFFHQGHVGDLPELRVPRQVEVRCRGDVDGHEDRPMLVDVRQVAEEPHEPSSIVSPIRLVLLDECDEVRRDTWEPIRHVPREVASTLFERELDVFELSGREVSFSGTYEPPGRVIQRPSEVVQTFPKPKPEVVSQYGHVAQHHRDVVQVFRPLVVSVVIELQPVSLLVWVEGDPEFVVKFCRLGLSSTELGSRSFEDAHV